MKRKLPLVLALCCGTAFAQINTPEKTVATAPLLKIDTLPKKLPASALFQGEALPATPQQNLPWPHGDDPLANAAATLFEQGLADPRGLEYRVIEIAVGNPWNGGGYSVKTHGWLLPDGGTGGAFAVAWNGLVYPVVQVGPAANLREDWTPGSPAVTQFGRSYAGTSESLSVAVTPPRAVQMALLLRLGEVEIVNRSFKTVAGPDADPYLALASDWAWSAFERAACAHERGDDRLALADARLLTRIQTLIEAEAARRGFKRDPDGSNSNFPDRKQPYLAFLKQLPELLADCERRVAPRQDTSPSPGSMAALIDDLQNVDARQWGQPGGVSLGGDQRVQALVRRGNEAVIPLLDALENDRRLTRSVSFGRDFFRSRQLIPVAAACHAALVDLLRVQFKTYGEKGEPLSRKELASQIRGYWAKLGGLSPNERFYAMLKDDAAGKDQWLQAAANIVQPTDVESHGGWTTVPNRVPGQKVTLRGESLRDGRTPSVAELMARRSEDIAAIRTHSTNDHFLYLDAGQMALNLADWAGPAAIPTLKTRLARAWTIGKEPNDILAFNGNPVDHFGHMIAAMTLARARCGDEAAFDEYAAWIQKADLKDCAFRAKELQKPLVQGAARPSIAKATDYLFNDPKSPWANVLAPGNGSWIQDFWQTPLAVSACFRKQAGLALENRSPAGAITFYDRKDWNSYTEAQIELPGASLGFRGSADDPDTPPIGQKRAFRVCDAFAYFYSQYQNGPKIQLFWPQEKRDAAVAACRKWLNSAPATRKLPVDE